MTQVRTGEWLANAGSDIQHDPAVILGYAAWLDSVDRHQEAALKRCAAKILKLHYGQRWRTNPRVRQWRELAARLPFGAQVNRIVQKYMRRYKAFSPAKFQVFLPYVGEYLEVWVEGEVSLVRVNQRLNLPVYVG